MEKIEEKIQNKNEIISIFKDLVAEEEYKEECRKRIIDNVNIRLKEKEKEIKRKIDRNNESIIILEDRVHMCIYYQKQFEDENCKQFFQDEIDRFRLFIIQKKNDVEKLKNSRKM